MEFSVRKETSSRWETRFCVVKCRLSSQAKLNETQSCFSLLLSDRASEAGSEFSLFEALRDSIYSEVATLISLNESRPHFLVRHHHVRFSISLTWLLFFLWFRLVFPISIVMYFSWTSSQRPLWGESMYGLSPVPPPPPKKVALVERCPFVEGKSKISTEQSWILIDKFWFLILQLELFRELQLLTSDYLRQRALYALQDLVTRFLTEDSVVGAEGGALQQAVSA